MSPLPNQAAAPAIFEPSTSGHHLLQPPSAVLTAAPAVGAMHGPLGLSAMTRQLPRLVGTGLRLAHLADARVLRVVLAAEAGRGIAQAVGPVAINSVLGHILASGSTNGRLTQAVPALMVVAITALLGSLLRSASTAATGALEPKVQRVATEQYLALVHRVEFAAIEGR